LIAPRTRLAPQTEGLPYEPKCRPRELISVSISIKKCFNGPTRRADESSDGACRCRAKGVDGTQASGSPTEATNIECPSKAVSGRKQDACREIHAGTRTIPGLSLSSRNGARRLSAVVDRRGHVINAEVLPSGPAQMHVDTGKQNGARRPGGIFGNIHQGLCFEACVPRYHPETSADGEEVCHSGDFWRTSFRHLWIFNTTSSFFVPLFDLLWVLASLWNGATTERQDCIPAATRRSIDSDIRTLTTPRDLRPCTRVGRELLCSNSRPGRRPGTSPAVTSTRELSMTCDWAEFFFFFFFFHPREKVGRKTPARSARSQCTCGIVTQILRLSSSSGS